MRFSPPHRFDALGQFERARKHAQFLIVLTTGERTRPFFDGENETFAYHHVAYRRSERFADDLVE